MSRGVIFDDVTDTSGNALPSISVTIYEEGTFTKATLFDARTGGNNLDNPLTTNERGIFLAYLEPGSYDISVAAPTGTFVKPGVPALDPDDVNDLNENIDDINAALELLDDTGALNALQTVDTLAELRERTDPVGSTVYVKGRTEDGDGYAGPFFITDTDYSTEVAADPLSAVYVLLDNGLYAVRQFGQAAMKVPIVKAGWGGAIGDDSTDNTLVIEGLISVLMPATSAESPPITVPLQSGGIIQFGKGTFRASTYDHPSYIEIEGAGAGATAITITGGGIRPVDLTGMAYNASYRGAYRDITIRGVDKTVTLFKNGVNTDGASTREYFNIVDWKFENVIFREAKTLMDWRGAWNIKFDKCQFRDAWLGIICDANRESADQYDVAVKNTEFHFDSCSFDQCAIPGAFRYAIGWEFTDCAVYRNDDTGLQFLEGCTGCVYNGGRLEGSPRLTYLVQGGALVKNGGTTIYQAITDHVASATDEPGVGASWTTYWREFKKTWVLGKQFNTDDYLIHDGQDYRCIQNNVAFAAGEPGVGASWETYFVLAEQVDTSTQWVSGRTYGKATARSQKLRNVGFLQDQASRTSAFFGTVTRRADDRFVRLDGDEDTIIDGIYSVNAVDRFIESRSGSINAVIKDCADITLTQYDGTYLERRTERSDGTIKDFVGGNTLASELNQDGLIRLPESRGEATLSAGVANTVIPVTGLTANHKVIVIPRNLAAANFFATSGNYLYSFATSGQITVNHPATTTGSETVLWFVL